MVCYRSLLALRTLWLGLQTDRHAYILTDTPTYILTDSLRHLVTSLSVPLGVRPGITFELMSGNVSDE